MIRLELQDATIEVKDLDLLDFMYFMDMSIEVFNTNKRLAQTIGRQGVDRFRRKSLITQIDRCVDMGISIKNGTITKKEDNA